MTTNFFIRRQTTKSSINFKTRTEALQYDRKELILRCQKQSQWKNIKFGISGDWDRHGWAFNLAYLYRFQSPQKLEFQPHIPYIK